MKLNKQLVNNIAAKLASFNFNYQFILIRKLACIWLAIEMVASLSYHSILFNPSVSLSSNPHLLSFIGFVYKHYSIYFCIWAVSICLYFVGYGKKWTSLLVFTLYYIHIHLQPFLAAGGEKMMHWILFYLLFSSCFLEKKTEQEDIHFNKKLISNTAAFCLLSTLCVCYLQSALAKSFNPLWQNGTATFYALQINEFKGTYLNQQLAQSALFVKLSTYGTLLFEWIFPIAVCFKKSRKVACLLGVLFHISLAIFLHLYYFQFVFLIMYVLFIPDRYVKWLIK